MIEIMTDGIDHDSATRRYKDSQSRKSRAEAAKRDADREYESAGIWEAQDMLLVLDLKDRAAGMSRVISTGLYIKSYGPHACASTTKCNGLVPSIRTVVLLDDKFVSAVFCLRHKRHAVHFGIRDCQQCGSSQLIRHDPERTKTPPKQEGFEYERLSSSKRKGT